MSTPPPKPLRILLGQLYSNGDCLFATTIARQIKEDFPDCHLTWAISRSCRPMIQGNPHVDEVWEIVPPPPRTDVPNSKEVQLDEMWWQFRRDALERKARGEFDEIFLTQIDVENMHHYDGTIRSTIYSNYPRPITVPVAPVLRLDDAEVERVRQFVAAHPVFSESTHRLLFECSPKSNKMFVNPEFALEVSRLLLEQEPNASIVLSSNLPIRSTDKRILDGSVLTLRENAELTKYCTLLVGCSSGISWIGTSDWAKPLPMVQLLSPAAAYPNSIVRDHRRWHLPTDDILEMSDCSAQDACECLVAVFRDGLSKAKARYHQEIDLTFSYDRTLYWITYRRVTLKSLYFALNNVRRERARLRLLKNHLLLLGRRIVRDAIRLVFPNFLSR